MNSKVIVHPESFLLCYPCNTLESYMHTFNKLPVTHAPFQFSNRLGTGNWWRTWDDLWRIYCSFVYPQRCRRFNDEHGRFRWIPFGNVTFRRILPAMAKCFMKKFIRDFRLLLISRVTRTAVFPRTMTANSIHNTVNCSVCEWRMKN